MIRDGRTIAGADVTARAAQNLAEATSVRRRSFGSVIGTLDAVSLHGRREAGIWTELHEHHVTVKFDEHLLDQVRDALGKRVEASGVLVRNYLGTPISIELRKIEKLRTRAESPPLTELARVFPDPRTAT